MLKSLRIFVFILTLLLSFQCVFAQIPDGYYDAASGQSGETLKTTLHGIIDDHTVKSYDYLWTAFQTTDKKSNGKVWDMYSDVPDGTPSYEFTFGSNQCGNYGQEGDCYNREHSFPKSWFNDASPMYSDLFHLVPTDGYVNGKRSNYPFGEVGTATWTSENGSKLGTCNYPGYSGTVFEPIDAYKGDFARTYFYMAVRYYTEDAGWQNNAAVNGSQLTTYSLNLFYQWHLQDTVSQKEIDRNNAVYSIQHNRNPFIDRPDWVDSLWFPSTISTGKTPIKFTFKTFPNPVDDVFNVLIFNSHQNTDFDITIYDISGRKIKEDKISASNILKINTSDLEKGIYVVSLVNQKLNISKNFKFVKQ